MSVLTRLTHELSVRGHALVVVAGANIPESLLVHGKARPTRRSDGAFIHATLEGIENFWNWFADSKAVDAQGRPLVLYHGTNQDFSEFREGSALSILPGGIYFTDSPQETSRYLGKGREAKPGQNPNVMPVFIRALRVADLRGDSFNVTDVDVQSYIENMDNAGLARDLRKRYDCVIMDGELLPIPAEGNHYIVFDPKNIKSATGNSGKFSAGTAEVTATAFKW